MRIYLAGSIQGKGYDEVMNNIRFVKNPLISYGYEVLHPMLGKSYLRNEVQFKAEGYVYPVSTNHAIFNRDKWMVSYADIILANLLNADRVSIGTMMELAWASLLNKHILVVMEKDNIHRHAFVLEASGTIFEDMQSAIKYLGELISVYKEGVIVE